MPGLKPHPVLPPVYFFFFLAAMSLLHFYLPVREIIPPPWHYSGLLIYPPAGLLIAWALFTFKRKKTTYEPFHDPSAFVVMGPYRYTRNPMYLGLFLVLIGSAVLMGDLTPFLLLPFFPPLITRLFIRWEEEKLEETFGEKFLEFKKRVRRWL